MINTLNLLIFIACLVTDSSYVLTDQNVLTVTWNKSESFLCNNAFLDINVSRLNCTTEPCFNETISVSRVSISNLSYSFETPLDACLSYKYEITQNEINETFTKKFETNEQFEKIKFDIDYEANSTMRVFWNNTEHEACPKKFRIALKGEDKDEARYSTSFNEIFEDLESCASYDVTITPLFSNNSLSMGYEVTNSTTMPSQLLTRVRNLTLETSRLTSIDSIKVTWVAPANRKKCVKYYEIVIESDNPLDKRDKIQEDKDTLMVNIPRVAACNAYTIRVSAKDSQNMSSPEVEKEITIEQRGKLMILQIFMIKNNQHINNI